MTPDLQAVVNAVGPARSNWTVPCWSGDCRARQRKPV